MNRTKKVIRKIWAARKDTARRIKKPALIAVGSIALLVVVMSFYGSTAKKEQADEHENEKTHEETAVVHLSEEAQKASGIEVMAAALEPFSAPIEATAAIELNGDRVAKISARTSGRLVKIAASQGDAVTSGQALAWFDSPELGLAWAEYAKAKGRTDLARNNLQREETLFAKKISPEKDVIRARQELADAEADFAFASEKFHLLGIDIEQVGKKHEGDQHPLIAVTSPISGSVIERAATQGEVVSPDKTLFTVADLSRLWVIIDIYEKDLGRVKSGTAVKVRTTAYPDRNFKGIISYIGDVLDEKTRTVKARVVVENANRLLKPGMFASVLIEAGGGTERIVTVPEEAVFLDGSKNYVFIQTDPEKFELREITVGRTLGNRLEVTGGLKKGEPVAVKGAFILKSELKKGELVDEHGHGE
ncbi:MAG: efflux RND transporter periplasmic adaptor subunit [Nitrospirae bacterium]|nr:efflux RND transporter periplasmic adaptor subunit [Nitrospirota bacterium]